MASEVVENRFAVLYEASKKFTQTMGLHDNLILEIIDAKTDWEFIIKIDAMLEAATKAIVKKRLNAGADEEVQNGLDEFAEALPMNGRTSLLAILKGDGCMKETTDFVEGVRRLRNGFAHDIRLTDSRLINIITVRKDKSWLIKALSQIENYDEAHLVGQFENDGEYLRFLIVDATLRYLVVAYNITNPDVFAMNASKT